MANPNEGVKLIHKTGVVKTVRIRDVEYCLQNGYRYFSDPKKDMPLEVENPQKPEKVVIKTRPDPVPAPRKVKRKVKKSNRRKAK